MKKLVVEEDKFKKKGLASFIIVSCSNCFYESSSFTSQAVQPLDEETQGMKPFEVNIRSVCISQLSGCTTHWNREILRHDEYAISNDWC